MRTTKPVWYIVALATAALLAACSSASVPPGAGPSLDTPQLLHPGRTVFINGLAVLAAHPRARARAQHVPLSAKKLKPPYQYISNFYSGTLGEFDYPKGDSAIGQITGADEPEGECADVNYGIARKRFWVVESGDDAVYEYAYKGTNPVKELNDTAGEPAGCAMDPPSGNLAVTILDTSNVVIFKNASGSGTAYGDGLASTYFAGYDPRGDLFVDGFDGSGAFAISELVKGQPSFKLLTPSNGIEFPGSIQWDGKYIAVNDQEAHAIYRYSCKGTACALKQTVSLSGSSDCVQTWIARGIVFCPDAGNEDVEVYRYPGGGTAAATLTGSFDLPIGAVGK